SSTSCGFIPPPMNGQNSPHRSKGSSDDFRQRGFQQFSEIRQAAQRGADHRLLWAAGLADDGKTIICATGLSGVSLIRGAQPTLHFAVDFRQGGDRNPVRNSVLPGGFERTDSPSWWLC